MHALPIHCQLELAAGTRCPRMLSKLVRNSLVWNDVLAVAREEVRDACSAQRAERHPVEVLILRHVAAHVIGVAQRAGFRVADRQLADLLRRGQIALLQRRRDVQRIGDVVEAVGGIIGRQQGCDVHVQRQEIADRVRILRAIQPAKQRRARDWDERPMRDRVRFRSTSRTRLWCAHRAVAHRPVASARRVPCARPFPRSRPSRRRRPGRCDRAPNRRSSAAGYGTTCSRWR